MASYDPLMFSAGVTLKPRLILVEPQPIWKAAIRRELERSASGSEASGRQDTEPVVVDSLDGLPSRVRAWRGSVVVIDERIAPLPVLIGWLRWLTGREPFPPPAETERPTLNAGLTNDGFDPEALAGSALAPSLTAAVFLAASVPHRPPCELAELTGAGAIFRLTRPGDLKHPVAIVRQAQARAAGETSGQTSRLASFIEQRLPGNEIEPT